MSGDAVAARAMPGQLNLGYAGLLAGLALVAFLGVPVALAAGHAPWHGCSSPSCSRPCRTGR